MTNRKRLEIADKLLQATQEVLALVNEFPRHLTQAQMTVERLRVRLKRLKGAVKK